jgi:hypothetical protein
MRSYVVLSLDMAKATLKTTATQVTLQTVLETVADPQRRADTERVCALMGRITGADPVVWGPSMIGFGSQTLLYESGRELDWFVIGCSPRKAALSVYILEDAAGLSDMLSRLGPHTMGKSCIYIKKLDAVNLAVLEEILVASVKSAARNQR